MIGSPLQAHSLSPWLFEVVLQDITRITGEIARPAWIQTVTPATERTTPQLTPCTLLAPTWVEAWAVLRITVIVINTAVHRIHMPSTTQTAQVLARTHHQTSAQRLQRTTTTILAYLDHQHTPENQWFWAQFNQSTVEIPILITFRKNALTRMKSRNVPAASLHQTSTRITKILPSIFRLLLACNLYVHHHDWRVSWYHDNDEYGVHANEYMRTWWSTATLSLDFHGVSCWSE